MTRPMMLSSQAVPEAFVQVSRSSNPVPSVSDRFVVIRSSRESLRQKKNLFVFPKRKSDSPLSCSFPNKCVSVADPEIRPKTRESNVFNRYFKTVVLNGIVDYDSDNKISNFRKYIFQKSQS